MLLRFWSSLNDSVILLFIYFSSILYFLLTYLVRGAYYYLFFKPSWSFEQTINFMNIKHLWLSGGFCSKNSKKVFLEISEKFRKIHRKILVPESCEVSKNFFTEHLWTTASGNFELFRSDFCRHWVLWKTFLEKFNIYIYIYLCYTYSLHLLSPHRNNLLYS